MRKISTPPLLHPELNIGSSQRIIDEWFEENIKGKYVVDEGELVRVTCSLKGETTWVWEQGYFSDDHTHQAYLIHSSIEEIKPCEHDDVVMMNANAFPTVRWYQCLECGKKLKPTGWEVCDG